MRPSRATAVTLAAATLLSACGPASALHLSLRIVAVTVPRIVTPALQLVAPSAPPPAALPAMPSTVISELPPPISPMSSMSPSSPPPSAVQTRACPPAPPLAVPEYPARLTVTAGPATQAFVQRSTGRFQTVSGKGSLDGSVRVTVTDLPKLATSSGQTVLPWQVQQVDPATRTRSVEVYQLLLPSSAIGASPPGVYLVGLAWSDPVRGTLSFQPSGNGLYVLPSPVQIAQNSEQYVGIATDPNTLTTLQLTRNVTGRKRVDVCGQLVDTWTVEMTGTLTSPSAQWNVTWNQQLATAYGAADVEELFTVTDIKDNGVSWTRRLISTRVPKVTR